jgi:hypothetical protein
VRGIFVVLLSASLASAAPALAQDTATYTLSPTAGTNLSEIAIEATGCDADHEVVLRFSFRDGSSYSRRAHATRVNDPASELEPPPGRTDASGNFSGYVTVAHAALLPPGTYETSIQCIGSGDTAAGSDPTQSVPFTVIDLPRTDGGVETTAAPETTAAQVVAAPTTEETSSTMPIAASASALVLAGLVALVYVKRPALAGIRTASSGRRTRTRRQDRSQPHETCVSSWAAASAKTAALRSRTSRDLGSALEDIAHHWNSALTKLSAASDTFAPLRDDPDEDPNELTVQLEVARRVLDGVSGAMRRSR